MTLLDSSTIRMLAASWFVIFFHAFLTDALVLWLDVWGYVLGLVLVFPAMALPYWLGWVRGDDLSFSVFWVLLFTSPIFAAMQGENILIWIFGGDSRPISVRQAESTEDRWFYHFSDARVLEDRSCGVSESAMVQPYYRSPSRVRYYQAWFVAPIVGADWKEGDPIVFWASCKSSVPNCRASWRQPGGGGYSWFGDRVKFREALRECGQGDTLGKRFPRRLHWANDPSAALRRDILMAWSPLFLGAVLFGGWIWRRNR